MATANTSASNSTDVLMYGCFKNFSTIACARCFFLTILAVLTAVFCMQRVIQLHAVKHQDWHLYFIYYCASIESVVAGVHWILSLYVQFDFVLQWLKLLQLLVMCHFYCTLATRTLQLREDWTKRFLVPFLGILLMYFTITAVLGMVNVKDTYTECFQPYWLMMSLAEFIIVQLVLVAGFYITRRLNQISTLASVRRWQKCKLWCIVVVFEVSALVGVVYDMTLKIVGDRDSGCSSVFKDTQEVFTAIFLIFMVVKLLLPIWVMLFVFKPTPQQPVVNDTLSYDGNSAFISNTNQYRQLVHPKRDYNTQNYGTFTSRSPVLNQSPPIPSTSGTFNSLAAANSLKRTRSNLKAIKEEANSLPPTASPPTASPLTASPPSPPTTSPPTASIPTASPPTLSPPTPSPPILSPPTPSPPTASLPTSSPPTPPPISPSRTSASITPYGTPAELPNQKIEKQSWDKNAELLGNTREVLPSNQVMLPKPTILGNEEASPPRFKFYI